MGESMWRYFFGIFLIACRVNLSRTIVLESIYWNTSNTKFIPGRGLVLNPQIGDKMDIVCPRIRSGAGDRSHIEYFRVYLVKRDQLESCSVPKGTNPLLNCDKPDQDVKFTFKFQEFSPNLWGLEFLKGKDYHIISTSNSSLEGLDNHEGGVCKTKSMKMVLRVGQGVSGPANPTRYPPKHSGPEDTATFSKENNVVNKPDDVQGEGDAEEKSGESFSGGSELALFAGVASGAVIFIIIIVALVALLRRRHRKHAHAQCPAQLSLGTLPKRGSNNNGSEPSDIIFPLRSSESMYCPHYEKVSGDYGHPVYIVQEMPPQSAANIYYKV